MKKGALISECGKYRYNLQRSWDDDKPKVLFIMLNPSTADDKEDDPTIRRCIGFAKSWGYGSLAVVNLFPYRATNPKELLICENPIGIENDRRIAEMALTSIETICAWGNGALVDKLSKKFNDYRPLSRIEGGMRYIDLAKDGTPKHPLYLSKELTPKRFNIKREGITDYKI